MATANPVAPSGTSNLTSTAPAAPHDPAREKVQVFMAELTQVEALEEAFNLFLVHRADLDQANEEMQLEVSHIIFMTLFYDLFYVLWLFLGVADGVEGGEQDDGRQPRDDAQQEDGAGTRGSSLV